jgi:hypothetical protein
MDMTLTDSQKRLAGERSQRFSDFDETRNWYAVEDEIISTHAYFRSLKSADNGADHRLNWEIAKQSVDWRKQIEVELSDCFVTGISRPYLAIAACIRRVELCNRLNGICDLHKDANSAAFIAVLDGAPEHARYYSGRHVGNGVSWVQKVKTKDSTFFEYCRDTMGLHRAAIVEAGRLRHFTELVDEDRAFQDACLGRFKGDWATSNAITAALHLRTFLTSLNYEEELPWHEQLHTRIVVASSWETALRALSVARRDEIVVESELFRHLAYRDDGGAQSDLFKQLDLCHRRQLLAAPIRLFSSTIS